MCDAMIQVAGVATFELRQELIQAGEIGHSSLITHGKLHMPTSLPPGVLVKEVLKTDI
jgi:hypothetical protein